jgi:AcrR family transcriptional regulator
VSRLATETAVSTGRAEEQGAPPEERLLDAAERLLVSVGYAGITTRRLAEEAGVNHGLVHYYFGSNDNLLVRALERFTERLIARQSDLYASDLPFVEKWRTSATKRPGSNCKRSGGTILMCGSGWRESTRNGGRYLPPRSRRHTASFGCPSRSTP